jgi:Ca2+/Na+ antiporter
MTVLKILMIALGTAFLLFGYFIYFRKKYHLINGFTEDYRAGRRDERYAERVGLIEFVVGIILIAVGVILVIAV